MQANLLDSEHPWAWQFWQCQLELEPGSFQIVVRAWDSAGNTRPQHAQEVWNFKGYMNNSWHQVRVERL